MSIRKKLDLPAIDSYSYKPLWKQVYEVLREAILFGKFRPGEKITELELCQQFNVSRTPVREAIRMLELEEFVLIVPQRGVFVAGIKSKKEINDIFQVRAELEGLASYLTAEHITEKQIKKMKKFTGQLEEHIARGELEDCIKIDISFHEIIYESCENEWLQKFLDSLFEQISRFRSESMSQRGRMEEVLVEYQQLIKAFEKRDAEFARKLAVEHIKSAQKSVLSVFKHQYD
ncbi:GntR family transcriptional regulator [Halocella sp. SP3-1]|uniref:GntR family transcriptional regulator n=1 Tax=Halocella sp. SP3-1 TaxID=2382161 RepID=UPI000F75B635|nr:GntR family transcriptional regulator [Halocella sp. SP3-1]AZO94208.1 GntR family transcriptional regulator [Halocella sp. SP3-1]